jgi:hypothetical protein
MRRILEQVDSCQGGELEEGIVILTVSRHIWINLYWAAPISKGGKLSGLLRLRARDSRRSKTWFLGWNIGQTQLQDE